MPRFIWKEQKITSELFKLLIASNNIDNGADLKVERIDFDGAPNKIKKSLAYLKPSDHEGRTRE